MRKIWRMARRRYMLILALKGANNNDLKQMPNYWQTSHGYFLDLIGYHSNSIWQFSSQRHFCFNLFHFLFWIHLNWVFLFTTLTGILIWRAIPLLDKSERFSYTLPNALNFSLSFAWLLRVYLVVLVVGRWYIMNFMYILRQQRYGKRKEKMR